MADEPKLLNSAILEAVKARVAKVSVSAMVASDTDCYGKNSPGDGYAKNVCSIDLAGRELVRPPEIDKIFGGGAKE